MRPGHSCTLEKQVRLYSWTTLNNRGVHPDSFLLACVSCAQQEYDDQEMKKKMSSRDLRPTSTAKKHTHPKKQQKHNTVVLIVRTGYHKLKTDYFGRRDTTDGNYDASAEHRSRGKRYPMKSLPSRVSTPDSCRLRPLLTP